jgi:putative radical SAM enzyme (TIGR03279 family)
MESRGINTYENDRVMSGCSRNVISSVDKNSIAEELEIEVGDVLVSINGEVVKDLIDYMYHLGDDFIVLEIEKPDGDVWELEIEKEPGEDLGLEFTNPIIDKAKSCTNKCIFCFIDQLPEGMRETLYFKDDDSRLSFLQGNFVTLTNMKDEDIERMVNYRLTPVNVSIHTTSPELRVRMLGNRFAGTVMDRLKTLTDGHIDVNGQIVLCRGFNDGPELDRTLRDLGSMENRIHSLAIVPFGKTRFREGLEDIALYGKEEALDVIRQVSSYQQEFLARFGTRFAFLSDEFYLLAGRELPAEEEYENFIQLENGVGLIRKFEGEVREALSTIRGNTRIDRKGLVLTGTLASDSMAAICAMVGEKLGGGSLRVKSVENSFFGDTITVSGLLVGSDIERALMGVEDEVVFLPESMFRSGELVFLDDMTLDDLSTRTGLQCIKTPVDGAGFIKAVLSNLGDN